MTILEPVAGQDEVEIDRRNVAQEDREIFSPFRLCFVSTRMARGATRFE